MSEKFSEHALLEWLRGRLPQMDSVIVGPGDDAAVLRPTPGRQLVVTTDMLMDGVDFLLAECDLRLAGRKSLAVNLSDLAAMAAQPVAAFVSLAVPRATSLFLVQELYEGIIPLALQWQVAVAGGDTNVWEGPLCISVTALGEVAPGKALQRGGARVGDAILATGRFGGSILEHHFTFEPRIAEAIQLAREYEVHAAMDVSDGLSLDVFRLATASGCGAVIDLNAIPIDPAAFEMARRTFDSKLTSPSANVLREAALRHALGDGEDFELILTLEPDEAARLLRNQPFAVPTTRIGTIVPEAGLYAFNAAGKRIPLEPRGYEHH